MPEPATSADVEATPAHDAYAALRHRDFRWFIVSLFTMVVGSQAQAVVVGWQVYDLTKDPLSLGLIGLAEALPFITVALFAGHVADRASRLRITVAAAAVLFVCSLALLAFTLRPSILHGGPWAGGGRVWPIYAVIFVS